VIARPVTVTCKPWRQGGARTGHSGQGETLAHVPTPFGTLGTQTARERGWPPSKPSYRLSLPAMPASALVTRNPTMQQGSLPNRSDPVIACPDRNPPVTRDRQLRTQVGTYVTRCAMLVRCKK
jgi:hypothetical protein